MNKLIILLFFIIPTATFSAEKLNAETLWFDSDLNMTFGFTHDGQAIFKKGISGKVETLKYTKINNFNYKFKMTDKFPYHSALIEQETHAIILSGKTHSLRLSKAPHITYDDVIGKWYYYQKDTNTESSAIITKREKDYDYDYVFLNHRKKTYSASGKYDFGVNYEIKGWLIYENSKLVFIITSFTKDKMEYTDMYGQKYTEVRHVNQINVVIPKDYKREN